MMLDSMLASACRIGHMTCFDGGEGGRHEEGESSTLTETNDNYTKLFGMLRKIRSSIKMFGTCILIQAIMSLRRRC